MRLLRFNRFTVFRIVTPINAAHWLMTIPIVTYFATKFNR